MLENLLWVDAFTRVKAHDLIKEVDEFSVAGPLLSTKIKPFLQGCHQVSYTLTKKLVLLGHYLGVVTSCYAEQAHVDAAMAVKGEHTALQGQPEREAGEDFQQDAAKTPHIENEGHLGEVLHSHICLLRKALRQERVYFGW